MSLPKFLLQVRESQSETVYRWTPALAARKDMRPITGKEAKKILDKQEAERDAILAEAARDHFVDEEDDFAENDVTATVDFGKDEIKKDTHPSFMTQVTMKADEIKRIKDFKTKNELEVYILEKYQLDMIPGSRKEMEEQAIALIEELAKHDKLYCRLSE